MSLNNRSLNNRTRFIISVLTISGITSVLLAGEADKQPKLKPTSTFSVRPVNISRPQTIKIATIGSLPAAVGGDATPDQILQHVKRHWQSRFAQVLPDRPDLIVVPENCDHAEGVRGERALAYYAVRGNQIRDYFSKVAKDNPTTQPSYNPTKRGFPFSGSGGFFHATTIFANCQTLVRAARPCFASNPAILRKRLPQRNTRLGLAFEALAPLQILNGGCTCCR